MVHCLQTKMDAPCELRADGRLVHMGPFKCYMITQLGGVRFPGKSITKMYDSTLLALRWGGCKMSSKKALRNT